MRFQYGIVSSALNDEFRQAPQAARLAGFAGLLIPAFGPSLRITELSASGRRELQHVLSAQDQQFVGLSVDLGAKGLGPGADIDRTIAQLDRVMEAAVGLGSPLVCVELGALPEPASKPKPKPKITPEQAGLIIIPTFSTASADAGAEPTAPPKAPDPAFVSQVDAALTELGRRADRYSAVVAFRSDLAGFAALERALRAADCPWFGVDLDPVAILRDEWSIDETFSALGGLIRHVRARDAVVGADRRTRPIVVGQGSTNWPELLATLDSAAYSGWITVDPTELTDRPAGSRAALTHLKRVAQ